MTNKIHKLDVRYDFRASLQIKICLFKSLMVYRKQTNTVSKAKKKSDSVATKDFYTSFLCKEKSFLNPLCSSLQFVARTVSEDLKDFHGEVLLHN